MHPSWRLSARGLGLRVWELGSPTSAAPPVVLLHGFLDHGLCWAEVARHLPGRRLLAPDQRGFGGSDRVGIGGAYHFPDLISDLDALVEALGEGAVDLVGHSMGGTVAGWYAGARPDRVRRLAIVEGLGPPQGEEDSALQRLRLFLDGSRRPPPVPVVADEAHAAARLRRKSPGLGPAHAALLAREGTVPTEDGGARRWAFDRRHLVRSPTPFREAWFGQALAEVTAPTLLVWGSEGWFSPEVRARRAALLPSAEERTLQGGHMLPYDAPQALGALLARHLEP
jgi:pimeloyl-ACP methyl ester carboxylesterase